MGFSDHLTNQGVEEADIKLSADAQIGFVIQSAFLLSPRPG